MPGKPYSKSEMASMKKGMTSQKLYDYAKGHKSMRAKAGKMAIERMKKKKKKKHNPGTVSY